MQFSQKSYPANRVAILVFEGFSNLCLANAVEPLRAANAIAGRKLYAWEFLSPSGGVIKSSSELPVQTTALALNHQGKFLCVMPSYGYRAHATPKILRQLRGAAKRFETVIGLDTGSWLMAAAELFDQEKLTAHWEILTPLAEQFPELNVVTDRFVLSATRASCGGAATTLELLLAIIARDHGARLALEVSGLFMLGDIPPDVSRSHNRLIRAATAVMRQNLEHPLAIQEIAARIGCHQRLLETLFRRHVGTSPIQTYRHIRLQEAKRWIEGSELKIAEVATRCGYDSSAAMTRAFKALYGLPPRALKHGKTP